MKKIILFVFSLISPSVLMAMNTEGYYPIDQIYVWSGTTTGGSSYVLIRLENVHPSCPGGYWLQDTTPSGNGASSMIMQLALTAYQTKADVLIYADENKDWAAQPSIECEIQLMVLEY